MSDLEQTAMERLRVASEMSLRLYNQPLVITYSGGKDSEVILQLARNAGIPFEVLNSHTTADAPETVRHIRKRFRELEEAGIRCDIDYHIKPDGHRVTMWNLIPQKLMPPTRLVRYCCAVLKEGGGRGRMIATGVRWAESTARKNNRGALEVISSHDRKRSLILSNDNEEDRMLFESCQMKGKRVVNPIVDWKDSDVWEYIADQGIECNPLYGCGETRVGCIGCPMADKARIAEFKRYPGYKNAYILAFARMVQARKQREMKCEWQTGEDVFHWWMEDGILPGQILMEV